MTTNVKKFVKDCPTCAVKRVSFLIPEKLHPLPICASFERLHIDLMGPLPESPRGNKYIVVIIDAFTKWVEATAIPDKEAATIADFFVTNIISRHGVPQTVVCDNGLEFSGEFAELCQKCYIELRHSSPNHPQTNGLVERFNKTLCLALQRSITGRNSYHDWDTHLHKVLFGYRTSGQASTKYSPFELLYGRHAVLPCENSYQKPQFISPTDDPQKISSTASKLLHHAARFDDLYDRASTHLYRAQQRQQRDYAARRLATQRPGPTTSTTPAPQLPPPAASSHATPPAHVPAWQHKRNYTQPKDLKQGDLVFIKNPHKRSKMDPDV